MEITAELRNAVISENMNGALFLVGVVYNDKRGLFPDGTSIYTSRVTAKDGDVITTMNSVYKILSWKNGVN